MPDSLDRIYRAVPTVACKGLCSESCGPIAMSADEHRRIADSGIDIPTPMQLLESDDPTCPALADGRCTVYGARPLICRLWGAVESMPCPHGCEVAPGLLMDAGAQALIGRSLNFGGPHA